MYAGYPEILAIVADCENRLNEAQGNSISRTKILVENLEEASRAAQKQVDDLASNTLIGLSVVCGGMTSTQALGTLITMTKIDNVAAAYAATYPIALICVVLACQIVALIM